MKLGGSGFFGLAVIFFVARFQIYVLACVINVPIRQASDVASRMAVRTIPFMAALVVVFLTFRAFTGGALFPRNSAADLTLSIGFVLVAWRLTSSLGKTLKDQGWTGDATEKIAYAWAAFITLLYLCNILGLFSSV